MDRFSTDLDLDFIGNKDLGSKSSKEVDKRMESDRKVFEKIALDLGLRFTQVKKKDQYAEYELSYSSRLGGAVGLDTSYRYCHSILGTVIKDWQMVLDGVIEPFKVQTQQLEELYASKITAIVETKKRLDFPGGIGMGFKKKARHLFDVYQLIEDIPKTPKLVNYKEIMDKVVPVKGMGKKKSTTM